MVQETGGPRLSSAEIVAVTTELRHRQANRRRKKAQKNGKEDADDAKRELVMEEHKQSISELVADLGTDPVNVSNICI
jgi:sodium/potassium-transporting ATPase subunit alpha